MIHTLRRWKHKEYRRAHRHEWPTMGQWLVLILCMLVLLFLGYVFDAWRMKAEATEVHTFNEKVLKSMSDNGKTPIYYTTDPDGKVFKAGCMVVEHRV